MSPKKLAKDLGLLRQRSSNGSKKSLLSNQIFSYLIVIDFESTCWREKNNYSQEIIEFPAVLLNTSTGEVESEFHTYVQPQEHPVLSGFCTELTGITQMQVEAGIPLQICLSRFKRWLQNLQLQMGVVFPDTQQRSSAPSLSQKRCTFLTWSDWDLGVCLLYECKRKQLHKPDVLNSWIDLRSTYRLFYDRKPKGLNGALQDVGIQFSGREHSGLDDARNTARLAARMMRDGCVMKITRSLSRAPLMVKPMFVNTTADKKKEKSTSDREENTLSTNKPSSSKIPPELCQIKSCSENIIGDLETKENSRSAQERVQICQSLISPRTLLKGTTGPLWGRGRGSLTADAVTNVSSPGMINCPSRYNNSSLLLCSTTVGCLSNLPQSHQLSYKTGVTVGLVEEEEDAGLFVETGERCGSYDDVVLEDDEGVTGEMERGFYVDRVWEEPIKTHFQSALRDSMRETMSIENGFKTQKMTDYSSMFLSSKMRSHVNVSEHLNEIRQHSTILQPSVCFAVPRSVTRASISNRHKTGLRASLQVQENSDGPHGNSKANTPFTFKPKPFIPEKTSSPNSSFTRPKAAITQHKETPQSSFTIYADPANPCRPSSCSSVPPPRNALSSLSANTLPSGKITAPLCACGRRARRQVVSNGGPNQGRAFYRCPGRRPASGGRAREACDFFKWESAVMRSPAAASSVSLCHSSSAPSRPARGPLERKSC